MRMASSSGILAWILAAMVTTVTADVPYDTSVCTVATPTVPLPGPSATLGEVWEAEVEWKDEVRSRSYFLKDLMDMPNKREKVVIAIPFLSDVTLHYDWNTQDVLVETAVTNQQQETHLQCHVERHKNTGTMFAYRDLFWLTSLQVLLEQFTDISDAVQTGTAQVRGIRATKWTACIYDRYRNMTVNATLYLSDRTWMSPYQPPNSNAPVRLEYKGRVHNGSQVTNVNLIGDIVSFKKKQQTDKFPPDVFTTQDGAFCPNRTGEYMRFPSFPSQLSLLLEVVDVDFTRISYQELFYDSTLKMVRFDYKLPGQGDSDPTTYISDFQVGVKYIIDRHMMTCDSPSALMIGDDFVTRLANGSIAMKTVDEYFHSQSANIQYAGQVTVRDVVCDTWIGHYFDQDANRDTTVQWYFTTGGSGNPKIYNVMRYTPTAPEFDVFDFSVCFNNREKKHFTIEFRVGNMQTFSQLSGPYLKFSVVKFLANRLEIQVNRFTDVTFDVDPITGSLFMSATLLDRAILTSSNAREKSLDGAFSFLLGSIDASHVAFNVSSPGGYLTLTSISLVEHAFRKEFATTTTTTPPTTKILAPTLIPPKRTTRGPTPVPTTAATTAPTSCPSAPPCSCPSCPPAGHCPAPTPCPVPPQPTPCPQPKPCPSSTVACSCPKTTATPCQLSQQSSSSDTGISSGALAGGLVAALVLGLVVGIIVTRLYHVTRVNDNQMTINLIEDNNI